MTHYETLGVNHTSTKEDIKKTYRILAKQHHPDTPTGDVEKFKLINEAYSVLSDDNKRKNYDISINTHSNFFREFSHFDDFDSRFTKRENLDIERQIRVTFKQAYYGSKVSVRVFSNDIQEFILPTGIVNGTKIVLEGKGEYSPTTKKYGNLNVKIFVDDDKDVKVINLLDIEIVRNINIFKLFNDTTMSIFLWEENIGNIKIPKGTDTSKRIRIQGKGIKNSRTGLKGDLYIRLNVITPSIDELPESLVNEINKYIGVTNGTK